MGVKRIVTAVRHIVGGPLRWWSALEPAERVLYRASGLLSVGVGMVSVPLAFIVTGALFAAVFFVTLLRSR